MGPDTLTKAVPETKRPLIGAQIRTAGGLVPVPERALAIGAEAVQIFWSNPRTWRARRRDPQEIAALVTGLRKHRLPLFLHTIYLINLATSDEQLRHRSTEALSETLVAGAISRATAVVTHIGSHHGEGFAAASKWVTTAVHAAWDRASQRLADDGCLTPIPTLLLETSSGAGRTVGGQLEELATLLASLPAPCGLCLDTAHLFAAGYPLHTPTGLAELVEKLNQLDLMESVHLIHLNDSRSSFASGVDRHENLGEGQITFEALARVVRHPAFEQIPFVLEVPGADGHGPDAFNVEVAKSMREGTSAPPARPARPA